MKQTPLHATAELHSDTDPDSTEMLLRGCLGSAFTGKQKEDDGWELSRLDNNPFRPAVSVRLEPDGEGTLIRVECRPDKILLIFMLAWTALLIGTVFWKGWLMLLTIPVFWAFIFIGFPIGSKGAVQTLTDLLSAYEILD